MKKLMEFETDASGKTIIDTAELAPVPFEWGSRTWVDYGYVRTMAALIPYVRSLTVECGSARTPTVQLRLLRPKDEVDKAKLRLVLEIVRENARVESERRIEAMRRYL